jgi:predicted permease
MARHLNAFVFFIAQPALIFLLASRAPFSAYDLTALGLYFISEIAIYAGVALLAWRVFGRKPREAILLGMTAVFVNHLYYVLPIAQLLFGAKVAAPIEGVIFIDVAVLFCGSIFVMDLAVNRAASFAKYPVMLAKNPALVALVLGIAANLAGDVVPSGLTTFASFTGNSAPPISLFALGIVLSGVNMLKVDGLLSAVVSAKVLVHPALVFMFVAMAAVPAAWADPILLLAAGPCGAMPFVIALQYKVETETIAKAILISTVLTLFSLAALTGLMAG